jgi:hypothetical protein
MSDRPTVAEVQGWIGARLDEIGGAGVGKIEGVYLDADSGEPEWLLTKMGRFGRHSLVPARDAVGGVGEVWVPYERETLRGAPRIEPGEELDLERETELSAHYEIDRAAQLADREPASVTARAAT